MLFCEGILLKPFETGAHSGEPSGSLHTGERVCYEAAAPNKEFQSLEDMGISWTSPLSYPCIFPFLTHSHTHTHPPSSQLPGPASVYCQCMVTMCRLVTECRPASEGLGPAYRTTS